MGWLLFRVGGLFATLLVVIIIIIIFYYPRYLVSESEEINENWEKNIKLQVRLSISKLVVS